MIHTLAIAALAVGLTMLLIDTVQRRPAGFTLRGDTGYLIIGRDCYRRADAGIQFGLGVRETADAGEIRWRVSGHVSWNWPRLVWRENRDQPNGAWLSRRWTGREDGGWCLEQPYFSRGLLVLPP